MSAKKPTPTWSAVKTKLSNFDHAGLICLVHDLYAASKDTRTSLHARLSLGGDALAPLQGHHRPRAVAGRAAAAGHLGGQGQESHRRLQNGRRVRPMGWLS